MKSYKLWLSVTFLLFTHWATAAGQSPGVVTGVVYSGDGAPAAGVRVYAFALQARADTANETPMESQATTDASGNYRLELPPGRYYIAAGSVSS
ncbi:MAG TPA: carboxypeptidase-like regulatory domain-containing protein, partial [Terriglobia bacterium]|nr:carboxypeptidase-like regulatory domain-containing protein [Terriglobia bacterium]